MREFYYCVFACILFNIILVVTCALPWYGVIAVSGWYAFLAIPSTFFGGSVCFWLGADLWDMWKNTWHKYFNDK